MILSWRSANGTTDPEDLMECPVVILNQLPGFEKSPMAKVYPFRHEVILPSGVVSDFPFKVGDVVVLVRNNVEMTITIRTKS